MPRLAPSLLASDPPMRPLLIGLLLFSTSALAQQITLTTQSGTKLVVGPGDCGNQRVINWTLSGNFCDATTIWLTQGTCGDTVGPGELQVGDAVPNPSVSGNAVGTRNFRVSDLPGLQGGDGGVTCGATGITQTYKVCGSTRQTTSDVVGNVTCSSSIVKSGTSTTVVYDAEAPSAPNLESVVSLDSALSIRVTDNGGTPTHFRVRVVRVSDDVEVASVTQAVDQNQFRVSGLENNVTYRVEAFARDEIGNESGASSSQEGTPVKTSGFFQAYTDAGGQETGGCNVAGGGLAGGAMLAALGFWLSSRRNRS